MRLYLNMLPVACARPVFCCSKPLPRNSVRRRLTPRDVRRAIEHAQLICYNYEDTAACRSAWDQVEELSSALAHQMEQRLVQKSLDEMCIEDPTACKEFDL